MKLIYDKESDTLSIILRSGKVAESDEAQPGVILDYDRAGQLVSIELLDASEKVHGPHRKTRDAGDAGFRSHRQTT